jgi:hypothetical protein
MENNNPIPEKKITKITLDDMSGLIARAVILANKENEFKFLQNENKTNWNALLKKYNLDPNLTYDIDQANCLLIWQKKEEKEEKKND